ncbi:hypothetical protein GCM10011575_09850 [Microlunatus endophyticus]|uniref:FAD-binding FR-type domain-containing protein n=1 Tax=Microlunatus endophyticus TaxID=1716077 RepID=A0A917S4A9_9ACTN|nr:siderophore-interacting protein [Microlunatus endophyticus]GGL53461.1 hypothetical protein GCM10011575_09850 [Microlunatus endophyticus]
MFLIARVAVRSVRRLSSSFARVELAGSELSEFGVDGPTYDQRIKIIFPGPSGRLPELRPDAWWQDFQALDDDQRCSMRTYTIRSVADAAPGAEPGFVVDFVVHPGAHGPGSDWACEAGPGDEVLVVVPRKGESGGGIEWAPPADADRLLLVGDETAVPAVASILESLPAHAVGTAVLEVPQADDVQEVRAPAGVDVRWCVRDQAPIGSRSIAEVARVLGAGSPPVIQAGPDQAGPDQVGPDQVGPDRVDPDLWETPVYSSSGEQLDASSGEYLGPTGGSYAWVAGESGMVTALRRYLVKELGMDRRQVAFMGYWRQGVAMRG